MLTIEEAYRGISWTTVILVAGMIPLSTAMTESGAAAKLADALVDVVGDAGPYALLLGLLRAHRGARPADQQHGDGADRDPVALEAAKDLDISARPVLMCVTVAAAAALLTRSRRLRT